MGSESAGISYRGDPEFANPARRAPARPAAPVKKKYEDDALAALIMAMGPSISEHHGRGAPLGGTGTGSQVSVGRLRSH